MTEVTAPPPVAAKRTSGPEVPPPPVAERSRTAPIECVGSQAIIVSDTTVVVTEGPAVRASGSCSITLINVDLHAPIGIAASGSASVTMTGGSIEAETRSVATSGSSSVNLVGTRLTHPSS